jgi:glycosyltransferase involved in cell wall biosynthesis
MQALVFGVPCIFEVHASIEGGLRRRGLAWTVARRRFVCVISTTQALKEWLCEVVPSMKPGGVVVIPNGSEAWAAELQMPSWNGCGRLQVGYVGSLYDGRGVDRVVEIATVLSEMDFHVVGGDEGRLVRLREGRLPENMSVHGFVEPSMLLDCYRRFHVVLMPYEGRVEGPTGRSDNSRFMSPLKMFEYMASGRAIVSSDYPVLREVLEDGRNALLVPAASTDAWIAALRRLSNDRKLIAALGSEARRDALTHYTWDARARRLLEVIEGARHG